MYPFKFDHIYFKTVWGGRSMESFRDDLPEGNMGESWDISCHDHGNNIIINGKYKGLSLQSIISKYPNEVLGKKFKDSYFPLHVSLIDAKETVSVQVHPTDKFALEMEGEYGKTEAWYILDCKEQATLVAGLKPCTISQVKNAIIGNSLQPLLNKVHVKKGDLILIPSGTVHALGEGILALEICQNSDTTYRVFDYGRGRELHIDKALQVINTDSKATICIGESEENEYYSINRRLNCEKFNIDTIEVKKVYEDVSNQDMFFTFTCVSGSGNLQFNEGTFPVHTGDSILIPASAGSFKFTGAMSLVKSYII